MTKNQIILLPEIKRQFLWSMILCVTGGASLDDETAWLPLALSLVYSWAVVGSGHYVYVYEVYL
jgi:hypothetical protein